MATGAAFNRRGIGRGTLIFGTAVLLIAGLLGGARPAFAADGEGNPAGPDVSVTIESGGGGSFGEIVEFGITVLNAGPGVATGVSVFVWGDLDGGAVTGLPGVECTFPATVGCPLGDLDPGQHVAFTVAGMMSSACIGTLWASVATATTEDPVPGNNAASRDFGQGCTVYEPPEDPCLDEFGNWVCSECAQGTVNAGPDQVVSEGDLVTLSGSWDDNILGHGWWQADGPVVVLSDSGIAAPTFTAPAVDADTILTFTLYGEGCLVAEDAVIVTVLDSPAILICPHPQGFWKTTPDSWPVASLVLGSRTFSAGELRTILETPVRKDARLILAVQLIAARLSLATGAPDSTTPDGPASSVADAASSLLGQAGGTLFAKAGAVSTNSTEGRQMTKLATVLEAYAKGLLTEGCSG